MARLTLSMRPPRRDALGEREVDVVRMLVAGNGFGTEACNSAMSSRADGEGSAGRSSVAICASGGLAVGAG